MLPSSDSELGDLAIALVAESARGPVRLGLPVHAVAYLLPGLFPEALTSGTQH